MAFVINTGTKYDEPSSYGSESAAKARKNPFPLTQTGSVKLVLGVYGQSNYENTAVLAYTFTAKTAKTFF